MNNSSPDLLPPLPGPNSREANDYSLPPPEQISGDSAPIAEKASAQALEQQYSVGSPAPPADPASDDPASAVVATTGVARVITGNQQPGGALSGDHPAIADDNDLIEKEWVEKAKQIVANTKHDPYEQNKVMSRMKVDYLKKRYNKDLKPSKDN